MVDVHATIGFECQECLMTSSLMDAILRARKGCIHCGVTFTNFDEAYSAAQRLVKLMADMSDSEPLSLADLYNVKEEQKHFIEEIGDTLQQLCDTKATRSRAWRTAVEAIIGAITNKLNDIDEEETDMARNAAINIVLDAGLLAQFNELCKRMQTTPEEALLSQLGSMLELDRLRNQAEVTSASNIAESDTVSAAETVTGPIDLSADEEDA